jgi:hypothetical protein
MWGRFPPRFSPRVRAVFRRFPPFLLGGRIPLLGGPQVRVVARQLLWLGGTHRQLLIQ